MAEQERIIEAKLVTEQGEPTVLSVGDTVRFEYFELSNSTNIVFIRKGKPLYRTCNGKQDNKLHLANTGLLAVPGLIELISVLSGKRLVLREKQEHPCMGGGLKETFDFEVVD